MDNFQSKNNSRRNFLTGIVPATCCLFSLSSFAQISESGFTDEHKFDKPLDTPITTREKFSLRYGELIRIMKSLSQEWGYENTIEFLKKRVAESSNAWAQQMLKNSKDNSFSSFIEYLEDPHFDNTLTFTYTEKTDKVCEIKVTECMWAEAFKKRNAGDLGYAYICSGDYTHCATFNPKIKMTRDKTLMQGHEYCNHRYVLED